MGNSGRVLIANRGEIARRIIRSCRRLGLETVAVYSEADAAAAHVEEADQAVLHRPAARAGELSRDRAHSRAARAPDAGLVHPGYGFLSENAAFARAVALRIWSGSARAPHQIETMGDKQRAREAAVAAGVPVLPGSPRFAEGDLDGLEEAAARGRLSAARQGCGRRRRHRHAAGRCADKLAEVAAATQSMAAQAFGDGTIYLERFVPRARHVEIQVFGFGDGHAIHLFERDCSVQRRFQKVIEESPAPGLPDAIRAADGRGGRGAGARHPTMPAPARSNIVVDADTLEFFFLEMNTRIQVEHPGDRDGDRAPTSSPCRSSSRAAARPRWSRRKSSAADARSSAGSTPKIPAKMFMPSPGTLEVFRFPRADRHACGSTAATGRATGSRRFTIR